MTRAQTHRSLFVLLLLFVAVLGWHMRRLPVTTADPAHPAGELARAAAPSLAEWRERTDAAEPDAAWLARGVTLATARRTALAELAAREPARALAEMMTAPELAALPPAVRAECEQPWQGTADRDLRWATTPNAAGEIDCSHQQLITVDGVARPAYSPQWPDAQPPQKNMALQGYRLGEVYLVATPPTPPVAADGGGPNGGDGPPQQTPYLNNAAKVLFIRVDFSDFPGEPVIKSALETTLGTVATRISEYSYGAASLTSTVTTTVYRMPASGASYATAGDNDGLILAARNLAAANYTLANYDVVAVYFRSLSSVPGSKITYGGLASVGGGNHWINGTNDVGVILHEFGHNYGLYHSNYWDPSRGIAGSYFDPSGSSLEYGDIFDRMGGGPQDKGYFSPYSTNQLGWLAGGKIVEPTGNGTWRIHRFDTPGATSNPLLALKVPMGGGVYYWVGHRKLYPAGTYNLVNGAYVVAEGLYASRPNLIDMTPGTNANETLDRNDAGLPVGSTYYNAASGVKFQTIASGGTAPNEWIDVNIQFDPRVEVADTSVEVDEQAGVAFVRLRRSFGTGAASVSYATANGTATAGSDYYSTSGTASWASGDSADKTVAVAIRPDASNEGIETFTLTLSAPSGAVINPSGGTATVKIHDPGRSFASFAPEFFNTSVEAIVPLPDGKVVIGGNIGAGIVDAPEIRHLARLNPNGSVDGTFLTGIGFNAPVTVIRRQSDGKLVVGGSFTNYNGTACNRVVRLNPNGTVDTAFLTALGTGPDNTINDIAIEANGKILLTGSFANFNGSAATRLVRLTDTGTRDTANPVTVDSAFSVFWINTVVAQTDGKMMIGGAFYTPLDSFRSGVARLNANGTQDATFNPTSGALDNGNLGNVTQMIQLADGKYLIGGSFTAYNGSSVSNLVRVNANGSYDSSFVAPAFSGQPEALLVQPSGAVVVGGSFTTPSSKLARLTAAGAVDPTFNPGGNPTGGLYALAQGPGGELWIGGNFFSYGGASSRPVVKVAGGGGDVYQSWQVANFSAAQIAAGIADPTDDPDGDDITNLGEMAVGTLPLAFTSTPAFSPAAGGGVTFVTSGPNTYLQLTLNKGASGAGLWYGAQFGTNLQSWTPASPLPGTNATYQVIEDSATRIVIRDLTPTSAASRRFARIVVRKPE